MPRQRVVVQHIESNMRIVRHIRTPERVILRTEIFEQCLTFSGKKIKAMFDQLGILQKKEPRAGWIIETRGTEAGWHFFQR